MWRPVRVQALPSPRASRHHSDPARRARAQVGGAAALAAALWLARALARGFAFSPDSMSYASLAHGFDQGHWFTSNILAWGTSPGLFQGEWPPLYPGLLAAVHALGLPLTWSEFIVSGLAWVAAATLGVLAIQTACGSVTWTAAVLVAGFPVGLYVAGFGWSEPPCLALLGLHFWLAARAVRRGERGPVPPRLFFGQALAAGFTFLCRYAAGAFLPAAVLLPAVAGPAATAAEPSTPRERRRRQRALWRTRARDVRVAMLGVALPVVPWCVASLALTGHVGPQYPSAGAGLSGALAMTGGALRLAAGWLLAAGGPLSGAPAAGRLAAAEAVCCVAGLALPLLARRRAGRLSASARSRGILAAVWTADALVSAALLIVWRARFRFDAIDVRLLTPTLYAALLAAIVWLSWVPWRPTRNLLVMPLAALVLWHGARWGAQGMTHPRIPATLHGPWCTSGPAGDCAMMAWLATHTTDADLIAGNAPFTINFTLGRTTEDVEPYPADPVLTPPVLRRWVVDWDDTHPDGWVVIALDTEMAPLAGSGPLVTGLWSPTPPAVPGLSLTLADSGRAFRIWLVSAVA